MTWLDGTNTEEYDMYTLEKGAYSEGKKASRMGLSLSSCLYREGTPQRDAWLMGYQYDNHLGKRV